MSEIVWQNVAFESGGVLNHHLVIGEAPGDYVSIGIGLNNCLKTSRIEYSLSRKLGMQSFPEIMSITDMNYYIFI